ncbi:hypothetical protein KBD75_04900 [Candidatus Woesebacteria bacterium]|nr:hypothetical protein [Candidatus Woesebacteria bacterium]
MNKIIFAEKINQVKVDSDIKFIADFIEFGKKLNWRVVVYGGYGLDGYLQTITRNHGDIDLVMYGIMPRSEALPKIVDYLNEELNEVEIKSKDEDFFIDIKVKSNGIQGNFYYVQTGQDPFGNLNIVVKVDGSTVINSPKDFPPPVHGKLGDLMVEVQDQSAHLQDIIRKRKDSESFAKHDQDIENLNTIVRT